MRVRLRSFVVILGVLLLAIADVARAQTQVRTPNVTTVPGPFQVTFGGQTFVNQGLMGMGRIAAGTRDFNNDSLGAFSSMDINLATWRKTATGYSGGMFGLPDRGPNGIGAVGFSDYAGRLNSYSMVFTPYTGTANLPASTASQNQLVLTQTGGFFFRDFNGNVTTGLDPGTGAASVITQNGIQLPGPTSGPAQGKISLDAEGVRFLPDRSFYISDEYGSNVYYFDASGKLQGVIRPPAALVPRDASGAVSYSSLVDATTGRRVNQGIEGMAITPDRKKLVTLAQSATMQDSTANQQDRTNTRLMVYDISTTKTPTTPIADYVLQLPIYTLNGLGGAPNRTAAQSELLALNDNQFLVLARDALGLGLTTGNSVFKSVLLVDIGGATNIAGSTFETTNTPLSPGGVLNSTIRPVQQVELVNMLNSTQLAKFGENLDNVSPTRLTLGEKWEGMALVPVLEEGAPQDFFLFVGNDNDFLASNCRVNNEDCSQSVDSDSHVLVYRLTLPTYVDPEYLAAVVQGGPIALDVLGQSVAEITTANIENLAAHMNALRRTGMTPEGVSAWASGTFMNNQWDDFRGVGSSADSGTFRGTFGLDVGVAKRVAVGVAVGLGSAEPETESGFSAETDGTSFGATLRVVGPRLFLNLGYAHGAYHARDITRPAAYGLTATGDTDASNHSFLLDAGTTFNAGQAKITPFLNYRYAHTAFDAFTDAGAAGGDMVVPDFEINTNVLSVGAEAGFHWGALMPTFHAAYQDALSDDSRVTLSLATAVAAMGSQDVVLPAADGSFGSAGVEFDGVLGGGRGFWYAGYTAEFGGDDRFGQRVNVGAGFRF